MVPKGYISSPRSCTQHTLSSEEHYEPIEIKCTMCYTAEEHINHTAAWCTTLAPSEHTNRHSKVTDRYCDHMDVLWTCTWKGHKCQLYHYCARCTSYHRSNSTSKL